MASATFQKFNCFIADLGNKLHNLNTDALYVYFTNATPVATNTVYGTPADLATLNGYTAGGFQVTVTSWAQVSGTATLACTSTQAPITASGAVGPFRYAVLYNHTAAAKNLIGFWDYGVGGVTLGNTDTFAVNVSAGLLTLASAAAGGTTQGAFNPFNQFVADLGLQLHNLNSDALKLYLTNATPVAGNTVYNTPADLGTANGYTATGITLTVTAYSQTSGTATLSCSDTQNVATGSSTWAASGAVGPFRYAVLYNSTAAAKNLINWWDYSQSISLANTDTFTFLANGASGVQPILTFT